MSSEPLFNEKELKSSLLNGDEARASEKTAAGSLIGCVRDIVGGKAQTSQESQERARTNDMLGEVAADTVAMMPGVSWLRAGGIRAVMMLNPKADATQNLQSAALNFTEGVALNKVSEWGGNALHDPLAPRSLVSESVGLFKFGAGMGAVKATFSESSWQDKSGQFSFGEGVSNIVKAGTLGGVIGVPAGLAGNRIAQFGAMQLAETGISQRALSVGLGMTSGYTGGAVFGGVDAIMHGGSATEVLKATQEGGFMGLFSGGLTGGFTRLQTPIRFESSPSSKFERLKPQFDFQAETPAAPKVLIEASIADRTLGEKFGADRALGEKSAADRAFAEPETARSLDLPSRLSIDQTRDLTENLRRLGDYKQGRIRLETASPDATVLAERAQTFDEFARMARHARSVDSRIYTVRGVEIHVAENYAAKLDQAYQTRLAMERGFRPGSTRAEQQEALRLKSDSKLEPGYIDRAHPADVAALLEQLPDRTLVRRVELVDHNYWGDAWTAKTYAKNFVTGATASDTGTMTFYKALDNADLPWLTHHEWGHFLENKATRDQEAFVSAAALEERAHRDRTQPGFDISEYSKRNINENWAEHSSAITKPDPTDFFETAANAPLRTAIIGRALAKSLSAAPESLRSPFTEQHSHRIEYINSKVLPRAQELLEGYLKTGTPTEQVTAAKLLRELGGKPQFEMLKEVARSSKNPDVAKAAFDAARELAFYGRESYSGYTMAQASDTTRSYVDFLVDMSRTSSRVRGQALQYLHPLDDPRAEGYYGLLTYNHHDTPHEQVKALFDAMQKIPEVEQKEIAFDHARRAVGKDPLRQYGLALSVFQNVPALKEPALRSLIAIDPIKTKPILEALAKKPTNRLNALAKQGLQDGEALVAFQRNESMLASGDPQKEQVAIQALGDSGEIRAIAPLLQKFAFSNGPLKAQIRETLDTKFTWQVVKAEIHKLGRQDPRWDPYFRQLVEHRPFVLGEY